MIRVIEGSHKVPQSSDSARQTGVSRKTDELASALLGDALDLLASGEAFEVLLVVQDAAGVAASYEFVDDGPEACLEGARDRVRSLARAQGDKDAHLGAPVRYALVYEGAVEDEEGAFVDALLLEFGELGYAAYSAFSLIGGQGMGDGFSWTDPAPAGEMEPLL